MQISSALRWCGVRIYAHICLWPQVELGSLYLFSSVSPLRISIYFHSSDQSSDHSHFHLLYLLRAAYLINFIFIRLLSFSVLFWPSICKFNQSSSIVICALLHLHTQMWSPNTPAALRSYLKQYINLCTVPLTSIHCGIKGVTIALTQFVNCPVSELLQNPLIFAD